MKVSKWFGKMVGRLLCLLACSTAIAQPDVAAITKDVAVKGWQIKNLHTGPAKAETRNGNQWWQPVEFVLFTGIDSFDLKVQGFAVYKQPTPDVYVYSHFDWVTSHYTTLPQVTNAELQAAIYDDPSGYFGSYYHRTVHVHEGPELLPQPYIRWYSIRSVEVYLRTLFTYIANDTDAETRQQVFSIRLFREAPDKPWKRFDALPIEHALNKVIKTERFTKVQIIKMYESTLPRKHWKNWKD